MELILLKAALYALMAGVVHQFISYFVDWTFAPFESREYLREVLRQETGIEPTENDIDADIEHTKSRWINISLTIYTIVICYMAMRGII